jgi:hypothetical protein
VIDHTRFDWDRETRTGVPEVVFAEGKTVAQLSDILDSARSRGTRLLLTRFSAGKARRLQGADLDYDPTSRTAVLGGTPPATEGPVGIVAAGTSDLPVATEAARAAGFLGLDVRLFPDSGVAGLWRLQSILPDLALCRVLVAVAGMEGALFPVLAGLVRQPVIAVPTSVGYGAAEGGRAALSTALASCSPGILAVNIDNGFGAAAAAAKILRCHAAP